MSDGLEEFSCGTVEAVLYVGVYSFLPQMRWTYMDCRAVASMVVQSNSCVQELGSREPEQPNGCRVFLCCANFFECVYSKGRVRCFHAIPLLGGWKGIPTRDRYILTNRWQMLSSRYYGLEKKSLCAYVCRLCSRRKPGPFSSPCSMSLRDRDVWCSWTGVCSGNICVLETGSMTGKSKGLWHEAVSGRHDS